MPDITYMTGQQLVDAASAAYQAVSGMTQAEAVAAVAGESYDAGLTQIFTFPMVSQDGGTPVTVAAIAAKQAWDYAKLTGAVALSSLGAATAGAKAWASGVLFGDAATAGTLAGGGGLLTMSLPAAAAAVAPLLGVSLGVALYESSPEFWTKISQTLLPFCYENTQTIPAVVDEYGQVYIAKEMVEALHQLFEDEGIYNPGETEYPPYSTTGTYQITGFTPISTLIYRSLRTFLTIPDATFVISTVFNDYINQYGNLPGFSTFYEAPYTFYGDISAQWIINCYAITELPDNIVLGQTTVPARYLTVSVQYNKNANRVNINVVSTGNTNIRLSYIGETLVSNDGWRQQYSVSTLNAEETSELPDGVTEWTGNIVDYTGLTEIPVVTGPDTTVPYLPITLPELNPPTSPDPEVEPDPIAPVSPTKLDPFIPPITPPELWPVYPVEIPAPDPAEQMAPQKEIDPIYIPAPNLDPSLDPSTQPEPAPDPLPDNTTIPKSVSDTPSTTFPPSIFPTIVPSSGSGLVHVYNPTSAQFVAFGHWLWVTYADTTIQKLWNNPFDGIIGAHELYATPAVDGSDTIKSGFLDSGVSAGLVRQRYTEINCGSIVIPEYWANYLDYSPYSKAYVYLPFIGIVEVDVDDIVGHSVNITYHVDAYNGSCIAQITVAKDDYNNTVYQFSGNCAVEIPMSGGSQASIMAGMITSAAFGIAGVMSGNPALGLSGVKGLVSAATSQKSSVQHSGSFGASYGAMGIKRPYIIIRRPIQKEVVQYNEDYGYPAFKRVILGSCVGYLRVKEVHVVSSLATDEEKAEIESILKSGVFVTDQEV